MILIREARIEDSKHILRLINELAVYEKLEHEVEATVENLEESIFKNNQAHVIIAEFDSKIVGYALYFKSYSTFLAKAGIYLEDLYVEQAFRGKGIGKKLLSSLAKIAIKNNIFILADETYDFLTYDNKPFFSFSQIQELKPNLILCASSSKEYSMTGYRIGWVIAPSDIMNHLLKFHDATTVCACVASQFGFIEAINGSQDCVKKLVNGMQERRDLICERLDRIPHLFKYYKKPQGAYYILPKIIFPHENSMQAVLKIQKETNVVSVPGIAFGESGKSHIRFSFGGGASRGPKGKNLINQAFDIIEEWGRKYL